MNIDHLSEDDISVKYITTALHKAGWDEETQIRRQVYALRTLVQRVHHVA